MRYNMNMKHPLCRFLVLLYICSSLFSCAPVIRKDFMDTATRNPSLTEMRQVPEKYKGRLFVFGGIIISTKVTAEGSLVEALYVPVDSRGSFKDTSISDGRFMALLPKENGILDPLIFKRDREFTFAGTFAGIKEGKIDEMQYAYPFFIIRQLYLWEERKEYIVVPPYYAPYPYWWDYPYPWGPYWRWRYGPPPYWW
jgi:outer membrane lipoprotein